MRNRVSFYTLAVRFVVLITSALLWDSSAHAANVPAALNISGALMQASGTPITQSSVNFRIEILDKTGTCVLYRESHLAEDLSASKGGFSLMVGGGTSIQNMVDASNAGVMTNLVFQNPGTAAVSGCGSVSLAPGDQRLLRVYYDLGSGYTAMTPDVPVVSSAYAMVAETLQGKDASAFLQVNNTAAGSLTQTNADYAFSLTNWPKLKDLIDGTSGGYMRTSPTSDVDMNGQRVINVASPGTTTDAVNKGYADSYMGGKQVDVSAVTATTGNGDVMMWSTAQNKWVAQAITFPNSGVTAGTYGSATQVGQFTVGIDGRITSAANVTITGVTPGGAAGGDLTGTYPNPTIANNAITPAKIKNTGIGPGQLVMTDSVTGTSLVYATCNLGEIMTWTAQGWACSTVSANAPVTSVAGKTGAVTLNAGDISGLGLAAVKDYGSAAGQLVMLDGTAHIPSYLLPVGTGTITAVTAGGFLTGGGTSGNVTLNVDVGSAANKVVIENGNAQIAQIAGSNALPAYSFSGDTNTGLYSPGADQLALATAGTAALYVNGSQLVGVGTSSPQAQLDVYGLGAYSALLVPRDSTANRPTTAINGMIRYNTSNSTMEVFAGNSWQSLAMGSGVGTLQSVTGGTALLGGTITTNGTLNVDVGTGANQVVRENASAQIAQDSGSVALPTYSFSGNTTTGIYSPGANQMALATNGTARLVMDNAGFVGLGTSTPKGELDIRSSNSQGASITVATPGVSGNQQASISLITLDNGNLLGNGANQGWQINARGNAFSTASQQNDFGLSYWTGSAWKDALRIDSVTANVGVGTNTPQAAMDIYATGASSALIVPRDTTANRPGTAINGMIRYNTSNSTMEVFANNSWQSVAMGSGVGTLQSVTGGTGLLGGTITTNGTLNVDVGTGANQVVRENANAQIAQDGGSVGLPAYSFNGNTTSGLYSPAANQIAVATNGTSRLMIDVNGAVGIGTATPVGALDVSASGALSSLLIPRDTTANRPGTGVNGMMRYNTTTQRFEAFEAGAWTNMTASGAGSGDFKADGTVAMTGAFRAINGAPGTPSVTFANDTATGMYLPGVGTAALATAGTARLTIDSAGFVGIGTTAPQAQLDVFGSGALLVPRDTTANRPATGINGMIRYNTSNSSMEVFANNSWQSLAMGSGVGTVQSITGGTGLLGGTITGTGTFNVDVGTGGNQIVRENSNAQIAQDAGTAALPAYSFSGNTTSGLYSPGTNQVSLATNGTARLTIDASGNMGLGTATPTGALDIYATGAYSALVVPRDSTANRPTTAINGMIRYNTSNSSMEVFANNSWQSVAMGSGVGSVQSITAGTALLGGVITGTGTINVDVGTGANQVVRENATSQIAQDSGSATSPSYSFAGNTDTGLYSTGTASLSLTAGGSKKVTVTSTLVTINGNTNLLVGNSINMAGNTCPYRICTGVGSGGLPVPTIASVGSVWGNSANSSPFAGDGLFLTAGGAGAGSDLQGGSLILAGGASAGTGSSDIRFMTATAGATGSTVQNATEKMRVNGDGSVGIGTATPAGILDVYATGNLSSILIPRDTTANRPGTGVNGMMRYNTTTQRFEAYEAGSWTNMTASGAGSGDFKADGSVAMTGAFRAINGAAATPSVTFANDTATGMYLPGVGTAAIATAGTARLTIDAAGNVGIGTTTPSNNLVVDGADGDIGITIRNRSSTANRFPGLTVRDYAGATTGYASVDLGTYGGTSGSTSATPAGNTAGSVVFRAYDGSAGQQIARIKGIAATGFGSGANEGLITFETNTGNSANPIERMRVTNSGSVGIGTTTVNAALDVYATGSQSSILVPRDTTANRPGTGLNGMMRYNTATNAFEFYQNGAWVNYGTGSGSTSFPLLASPGTTPASAPSYSFTGNTNSGLFSQAAGTMALVSGGTTAMTVVGGNIGVGTTSPTPTSAGRRVFDLYQSGTGTEYVADDGTVKAKFGTNTSNSFIGSYSNHPLAVLTNNILRMTVDGSGNVAIGANNPAFFVDVQKDGAVLALDSISTNPAARSELDFSENGTAMMSLSYDGSQSAPNNAVNIRNNLSSTDLFTVLQSGAIGIGTTSPNGGLDVNTTGVLSSILVPRDTTANRPATGLNGMIRYNTASNAFEFYQNGAWVNYGTGSGVGVTFPMLASPGTTPSSAPSYSFTGNANSGMFSQAAGTMALVSGGTTAMTVVGGNIGIGTTTPGATLEVNSGVVNTSGLKLTNLTASSPTSAGQAIGVDGSGNIVTLAGGVGGGTVWQMICSHDFGSAATSYVFNAASTCALNGDTDVTYKVVSKIVSGSSSAANYYAQPNADTGANYSMQSTYAQNSTNGANRSSMGGLVIADSIASAVGAVTLGETLISAKSGVVRTSISQYNSSSTASLVNVLTSAASRWSDTSSNISSLQITSTQTGGIGAGSRIEIWAPRALAAMSPWSTSGPSVYLPSGNVGIGTSSPAAALDVALTGGNSAIVVPRDSTANRPASGLNGMIRYNTDISAFEFYQSGAWVNYGTSGAPANLAFPLLASPGTTPASAPSYSFTGNTNSGLFSQSAGTVALVSGGTTALTVNGSGVGIGTATPGVPLNVTATAATSTREKILEMHVSDQSNILVGLGNGTQVDGAFAPVFIGYNNANSTQPALQYSASTTSTYDTGTTPMMQFIGRRVSGDYLNGTFSALTARPLAGFMNQGDTTYTLFVGLNGTVGVGTNTPGGALDVYGTGAQSSLVVPRDTTANRPTGVNGMIRYNSSTSAFEFYQAGTWVNYGTGSGSSVSFPLQASPGTTPASAPSYSFAGNTNSGLFSQSAGTIALVSGGTTALTVNGGNVGIGTTAPAGALEVNSITSGFLPPRVTTAQMNAIASPSPGMMVFNTTDSNVYVYRSGAWSLMASGGAGLVYLGAITVSGSPQATITFSSIPSGYTNLKVTGTLRATVAATTSGVFMRLNNDSGANYDYEDVHMYSTATSFSQSLASTSALVANAPGSTAPANYSSVIEVQFPQYSATTLNKTISSSWSSSIGSGTFSQGRGFDGLSWRSNAAINQIDFLLPSGNFEVGSSLALWGETSAVPANALNSLSTAGGTLTGALAISAGGATIAGGINNNSGGISNAGSITGLGSNLTGTSALTIAAGGAAQNLTLNSATSGSVLLGSGNGTSLAVLDGGTSTVNYITAKGAAAGGSPILGTAGSDGSINLTIAPKGSGNTIFSSGNVGIGTTAPNGGLDINATGTSSSLIVPRDTTANRPAAGVNGMIRYNSSTSAFEFYQAGAWVNYGTGGGGGGGVTFPLLASPGTTPSSAPSYSFTGSTNTGLFSQAAGTVALVTGGTVALTANGGSIGIGTAAPLAQFDIYQASSSAVTMSMRTPGTQGAQQVAFNMVTKDDGNGMGTAANRGWQIGARGDAWSGGAPTPDSFFYSYWNGSAWIPSMTITPAGNVGIGTNSPAAPLEVGGNIAFAYGSGITVSPSASWGSGTHNLATTYWNGSADAVDFYTPGNHRATPVMTTLSSGNVGIGTTTPASLLHVSQSSTTTTGLTVENPNTAAFANARVELKNNNGDLAGYSLYSTANATAPGIANFYGTKGVAITSDAGVANGGSDPVRFFTGGYATTQERVRIDGVGNVGIGTTAANGGLDIATTGTSSSIVVPRDTTANRPTGVNGMIRYNTNTASFEFYQNGGWVNYGTGGGGGSVSFPLLASPGTTPSSAPSYSFTGNTNSGLFSQSAGTVALVSGGTTALTANGANIGIGTITPGAMLDVNGAVLASGSIGSREVAASVAAGATYPGAGGIDMSTGNVFTLNASAAGACPTVKLDFTKMTAGLSYTVSFVGYNSGTCTVQDQTGATTNVKFYGGSAPTLASAQDVVCSAVRIGTKLYLSCLNF